MTRLPEDRAVGVRPGEELDRDALAAYLEHALGERGGELEIEQFPGGYSNLTYLIRLGGREWVLRRPPFGSQVRSAHDMGREYRVLSALSKVYPKAPRPLAHCDDTEVLGAPFYLMERVSGVILRPRQAPEAYPGASTMASVAGALVETLVELHAVDYRAVGLGDLGRPEGYVERQVEGWAKRYHHARTDEHRELERVAEWLAERLPAASAATLIHNDFKYDNLVLDPDNLGCVVAVLDWEMATLGDPLMDLGTMLGYWVDADDPPQIRALELSPTTVPGNPTRAEVASRYAQESGRDLGELVFYYAFGLFKIAVIIQQIYYRFRAGHTQDPRFARLDEGVEACGLMAEQAIRLGRVERLFEN